MASIAESFVAERQVIPSTTDDICKVVVRFGEVLCGIKLYNYQRVFSLAIIKTCLLSDGARLTGLYSRQSGKTEVVAVTALACAVFLPALAKQFPDDERVASYVNGFRVGIYGPKQEKAQLAYDRVRAYAESERADEIYRDPEMNVRLVQSRGNSIAYSNGSIVVAKTASEQVDNEGDTWHMLIVDEAQKISRLKFDKQLKPTITATGGAVVLIGTATAGRGYFYRRIELNLEVERETGKRTHFQYEYDKVIAQRRAAYEAEQRAWKEFTSASPKRQAELLAANGKEYYTIGGGGRPNAFHLKYEQSVQVEIAELRGNLDDESFKMNYRLIWQDNRSIAIPEVLFKSLRVPNLEMNTLGAKGMVVAGLDIAKGVGDNADQTVLTIGQVDIENPIADPSQQGDITQPLMLYNKVIIGLYTFAGSFENKQYNGIVNTLMMYPTCCVLTIDATGMGDPVYERLEKLLHWMHVEPFVFGLANKSMMYKKYLMELKGHRIRYAAGPETVQMKEYDDFVEEHLSLQRRYHGSFLICEAEDEDEHDDYPDSGALMNLSAELAIKQKDQLITIETSSFHPPKTVGESYGDGRRSRADRYRRGRMGGRRR